MIQYKEVELSVKMVIPVDEDPYGLDLEGIQDKACALEIGVERENPVTIDIALGKITDYAGELHTHCLSDEEIKALQEQPRIIGDFEKQHTDNCDHILEGETVQFDAEAVGGTPLRFPTGSCFTGWATPFPPQASTRCPRALIFFAALVEGYARHKAWHCFQSIQKKYLSISGSAAP